MYNTIEEAIKAGLWPPNKVITTEKGLPELEDLGYRLFYIGKNADLYFIAGKIPCIGILRTDRVSVFNIPLSEEIICKSETQTSISNIGFDFAESNGINTLRRPIPKDIPKDIARRFQVMEMARPIEAEINVEQWVLDSKGLNSQDNLKQFEFIYRFNLTGSVFTKYYSKGLDPYELNLEKGLQEWAYFEEPLFTPTTKCAYDLPLSSVKVKNLFPDMIKQLQNLCLLFKIHCEKRGLAFIDTKLEVFIDSNGNWALGDEVFTTESSRYISACNYLEGDYISMDKEILRKYGKFCNWEQTYQEAIEKGDLSKGDKLPVWIPDTVIAGIVNGYNDVQQRLEKEA